MPTFLPAESSGANSWIERDSVLNSFRAICVARKLSCGARKKSGNLLCEGRRWRIPVLGCNRRTGVSMNKENTPGPKQSSMTEMPVVMPQNVPAGAQQSPRRRTMIWLGTATRSSRMLPRRSQRVLRLSRECGSSDLAKLRKMTAQMIQKASLDYGLPIRLKSRRATPDWA